MLAPQPEIRIRATSPEIRPWSTSSDRRPPHFNIMSCGQSNFVLLRYRRSGLPSMETYDYEECVLERRLVRVIMMTYRCGKWGVGRVRCRTNDYLNRGTASLDGNCILHTTFEFADASKMASAFALTLSLLALSSSATAVPHQALPRRSCIDIQIHVLSLMKR